MWIWDLIKWHLHSAAKHKDLHTCFRKCEGKKLWYLARIPHHLPSSSAPMLSLVSLPECNFTEILRERAQIVWQRTQQSKGENTCFSSLYFIKWKQVQLSSHWSKFLLLMCSSVLNAEPTHCMCIPQKQSERNKLTIVNAFLLFSIAC